MTLIDIFDDRYQHIGVRDKKTAHREALWHRTFSCLAINPVHRTVLLQKKSPGRYSFERPDYADITVGGHYHAGEEIPDGVREIHEELGLPVPYTDLQPLDYPDFLALAHSAAMLISDSGGVLEEASVVKTPIIIVRRSTERPEIDPDRHQALAANIGSRSLRSPPSSAAPACSWTPRCPTHNGTNPTAPTELCWPPNAPRP